MHKRLIAWSVALAVMGGAGAALAQETATPAPDPRLQKQLTLSGVRMTLDGILKEASAQSGVLMRADVEKKAWKTRELPISLQVNHVTVESFQKQLAKLLDLRWVRAGVEGKWTYTIWQDKNAREREARAAQALTDERANRLVQTWADAAARIERAAQMSPEELARSGLADDFTKFTSQDQLGRPYAQLVASLAPAAMPRIVNGRDYTVPFQQLSQGQRQAAQQFAGAMQGLISRLSPNTSRASALESVDWTKVSVVMRGGADGGTDEQARRMGLIGLLQLKGGGLGQDVGFPILDPSSKLASILAQGLIRVNDGEDPMNVAQQLTPQLEEAARAGAAEDSAAASAADDPALQKAVELKPGDASDVGAVLAGLVDQAGVNVYTDGWKQTVTSSPAEKGTVAQVLDRVCRRFNVTWEYEDGAVRVRSANWATRRQAMVPRADIKYWAARVEANGALGLDELGLVCSRYTPEQVAEMMSAEPRLAMPLWAAKDPASRAALVFWGSLNAERTRLARTEVGAGALTLSPAQRNALLPVLEERGVAPEQFFVEGGRVKLDETTGGRTTLKLLYPPDRSVDIMLRIGGRPAPAGAAEKPAASQPQPGGR